MFCEKNSGQGTERSCTRAGTGTKKRKMKGM